MRLGLVPAWIFLISAEAIASTGGLGYRIFLVRRYLAMDVILPYVAWITLLAYALDRLLLLLLASRLPLGASRRETACELRRRRPASPSAMTASPSSATSTSRSRKARSSPSSARPAAASRRSSACSSARSSRATARSGSAGRRSRGRPTPDRGIVFQRYSVFPHLTVTENLILPLEFERAGGFGRAFGGGAQEAPRRGRGDCSSTSASAEARDRYPAQLSGGMQQRLAIAQALLEEAEGAPPRRAVRRARSRHPPRHAGAHHRRSGATPA